MLHIAHGRSPTEDSILASMFDARRRVFVDLLGWDLPVLEDRFEIDQFDTDEAIYLVVTGAAGEHRASCRLLPSTMPHVLSDIFAWLCDGDVPRDIHTFEITRFCLDPRQSASRRREARNCLVSSIVDVGLHLGIRRFTGIAEAAWLDQILAFGWRCRRLGPPARFEGRRLGALEIFIDADTRRLLRAGGIYDGHPIEGSLLDAA